MDFVQDALFDGRASRMLTVVDQYSRQSPLTEPAFVHSGMSISVALERVVTQFTSMDDARRKIEAWRQDCNHTRPHSSLRNPTPHEFAQQGPLKPIDDGGNFQP